MKLKWNRQPGVENYEAALQYLSLKYKPEEAEHYVRALENAPLTLRRANDVLRAVNRKPVPPKDPSVARILKKISNGQKIHPLLMILDPVAGDDIADGFHRLSAIVHLDPNATVELKIAK